MNKIKKLITVVLCVSLLLPYNVSAHSGRTDSSGGHRDNKNASGLGYYHYHCGGYPAHLHPDGVCPYSSSASSSSSSSAKKTNTTKKVSKYYWASTVKKVQKKLNKLGYKCGKADGVYGKKTKKAIKKFQKDEGLTVSGSINKVLLKKLKISV